jgi:hypothetical protein
MGSNPINGVRRTLFSLYPQEKSLALIHPEEPGKDLRVFPGIASGFP